MRFKADSFLFLNFTQFLGALNDNIYKLLIVFLLIQTQGKAFTNQILAISGFFFVVPFLLFSAAAGKLADRFSKQQIIVFTKILEIVAMGLGVLAFQLKSGPICYAVLFLMATQSSLFGPSKYGIVPELVKKDEVPAANGILSLFTYVAIIMGSFLAGVITEQTDRNFVLAGIFCMAIAVLGTLTSLFIKKTKAAGQEKQIYWFFPYEIFLTLVAAHKTPNMTTVILGNCGFYAFAIYCQLNLIPFAIQSLGLCDVSGSYLYPFMGVGIGVGSMAAGYFSKGKIRLDYLWKSCFVLTGFLFSIFFIGSSFWLTALLLFFSGAAAGFYIVPTDSFIQCSADEKDRGELTATNNFMGFSGVLVGSFFIYLFGDVLGLSAAEGFVAIGVFTSLLGLVLYKFLAVKK